MLQAKAARGCSSTRWGDYRQKSDSATKDAAQSHRQESKVLFLRVEPNRVSRSSDDEPFRGPSGSISRPQLWARIEYTWVWLILSKRPVQDTDMN